MIMFETKSSFIIVLSLLVWLPSFSSGDVPEAL